MRLSIDAAARDLRAGLDLETIARRSKARASFGGSMRKTLVSLLNFIGINQLIRRPSTAGLWSKDEELVHFTSCLRYPVFVEGKNYSGQPDILRSDLLRNQLEMWLVEEMQALPDAIWIALGDRAGVAARHAAGLSGLSEDNLVIGLPHPSGANNERVAYLFGQKSRIELSVTTNDSTIDSERERILAQVARMVAKSETESAL